MIPPVGETLPSESKALAICGGVWDISKEALETIYALFARLGNMVPNFSKVLHVLKPRFLTGAILNSVGQTIGTLVATNYSSTVTRQLINKTVLVACQYLKHGAYATELAQAGALVFYGGTTELVLITTTGVLAGQLVVYFGGVAYALIKGNPEHDELIREWEKEGEALKKDEDWLSTPEETEPPPPIDEDWVEI